MGCEPVLGWDRGLPDVAAWPALESRGMLNSFWRIWTVLEASGCMYTHTCTLELFLSATLCRREEWNETLGCPEPSLPPACLMRIHSLWTTGFQTQWGASHPPHTFQHSPRRCCSSSSDALSWCGTGGRSSGCRATLGGGRSRDHPGLCTFGPEGPRGAPCPPSLVEMS